MFLKVGWRRYNKWTKIKSPPLSLLFLQKGTLVQWSFYCGCGASVCNTLHTCISDFIFNGLTAQNGLQPPSLKEALYQCHTLTVLLDFSFTLRWSTSALRIRKPHSEFLNLTPNSQKTSLRIQNITPNPKTSLRIQNLTPNSKIALRILDPLSKLQNLTPNSKTSLWIKKKLTPNSKTSLRIQKAHSEFLILIYTEASQWFSTTSTQ